MSMFSKNQDAAPGAPAAKPAFDPPAAPPAAAPVAGFGVAPAPSPARPAPGRTADGAASVLGPDLSIRGGIEGRGEIQLQGRAWGDVKVERLIVGESAELEGSVVANLVEVRGRVGGSIEARSVRLLASSRVEGDITYETLQIEVGAHFEGRCIRGFAATPPVPAPAAKEASAPAKPPAEAPAAVTA